VDLLKRRPLLRDGGDRLRFPWGYGVVLPNLDTGDVRTPSLFGPSLAEVIGPSQVLTADDLTATALLPQLRRLFPSWSRSVAPLSPADMDEIRGALFPEIRVGWGQRDANVVRVMDREQDRLARTLGEGHRLLRGVAGSGKTVTLICRVHCLRERHPDWRILVVCYNRALAAFLGQAIEPDARLEIRTFHAWCLGLLNAAGIRVPKRPERGDHSSAYWLELPDLLLEAFTEGRVAPGAYQAILVDEGPRQDGLTAPSGCRVAPVVPAVEARGLDAQDVEEPERPHERDGPPGSFALPLARRGRDP